ncbi:MAG: hypothetical protein HN368_13930, partial [Spirochaetales bacterium]|nr:hypothetical protein [Spirochaetales bacterium]
EINFGELLGDIVEEDADIVLDFQVSQKQSVVYLVSSLFTLKVAENILNGLGDDISFETILGSEYIGFAPDLGAFVTCIGFDESGTESVIFLGTTNGLYTGKASTAGNEFFAAGAAPALVGGTGGYPVKDISVSPEGSMVALISNLEDDPELLVLIDTAANLSVDFRTFQGLPGNELHNMVWLDNEMLAVSGDHGLAVIDTTDITF